MRIDIIDQDGLTMKELIEKFSEYDPDQKLNLKEEVIPFFGGVDYINYFEIE